MQVKLKYAVIPAGGYSGMPALWLSPSGRHDMGFSETRSVLINAFTDMNIRFKALVFDVREGPFPEDDLGEITQLLDWAMDNAAPLHYLNGKQRPSYVRMGGMVKTFIESDDWLRYPTHELYWRPPSADAPEPELAEYEAVPKYVVLGGKLGPRFGMDFLAECKKPWGIVNPPKREVEVVLYD